MKDLKNAFRKITAGIKRVGQKLIKFITPKQEFTYEDFVRLEQKSTRYRENDF